MRKHCLVFVLGLTAAVHAAGQDTKVTNVVKYRTPRTADGHPDLQGVWNFSSNVPLERPAVWADKKVVTLQEIQARGKAKDAALKMVATFAPVEAIGIDLLDHTSYVEDLRTSLITYPENGRLPKTVDGVARAFGADQLIEMIADAKPGAPPALPPELAAFLGPRTLNSHRDFNPSERCIIGAPSAPLVPDLDLNYVQILQSRTQVALLGDTDRRIAPLDGRPTLSPKLRTWSGDARAHWEGDTLVVETRNFNNRTRSFAGTGFSAEKTVTERFTRRSAKLMDYEATIVDPKTFTEKVVIAFPMALVEGRVYENACHEHNYSLANSLSAARKAERDAAVAKP
jgi:hypothetical protein